MLKPASVERVQMDMLPTGTRFIILVVLLVATVGLAAIACADWVRGRHVLSVFDALLCGIAAFGVVRSARPMARTRFFAEDDPFDGSRGILWSVVVIILVLLVIVLGMLLTSPDGLRGFMDGWREGR
jgi:energy-coupling factor transporter transmembrane protein EcfT